MNRTLLRLSTQALFGRRRGVVLLLIAGALLALAVFVRVLTGDDAGLDAVVGLGFTLALPLVALLAATAVLGPEVDDGRRERLDEGRARVGEACDGAPLAERLVEGASENEPRVLDRVVVIHPGIAPGLNCEVHAGMGGEQAHEMVQKS